MDATPPPSASNVRTRSGHAARFSAAWFSPPLACRVTAAAKAGLSAWRSATTALNRFWSSCRFDIPLSTNAVEAALLPGNGAGTGMGAAAPTCTESRFTL